MRNDDEVEVVDQETGTPEVVEETKAPVKKKVASKKKTATKKAPVRKKAATKKAPVKKTAAKKVAPNPKAMTDVLEANKKNGTTVFAVPIGLVVPEEGYNPRLANGDLTDLEISMKANGFLPEFPITVLADKDQGKFVVRAGHRRLATALKLKMMKVWIQLRTSEVDDLTITVLENEGKPFSLYELSQAYTRMRESGMSIAEISKRVGKRQRYVKTRLEFAAQAPDELKTEAMATGNSRMVSDTDLVAMFRKHQDEPEKLVKAYKGKRQAAERLASISEKRKEGKLSAKEAKEEREKARPGMSKGKATAYLKTGNRLYLAVMRSREPLDEDNKAWVKFQEHFRELRKLEREGLLK